jgi:hypothetical protein
MPDLNTVGELIDYLATQPRDRKVVMSSDAEGNKYSPLADVDEAMYLADSTWSGEAFMTDEQLDERIAEGGGWGEDDRAPEDAERVVVLGPVN